MTPDKLSAAIDVVREVGTLVVDTEGTRSPDDAQQAVQLALSLAMAHSFMVELFVYLTKGEDLQESILKAIRGELPVGGKS
jgi:flagellar biosynthesis GTPase FlhF